ncbi:MAG: type II toxin-antitoxin system VapC family toxin [Thaumarchaeota archaeon]|nr:type II toxin-antitoxin system VapC family toxin [Nitrososphaerota archaeon]
MRKSTSSRSVIDTFAWVEYLLGSRVGTKVKEYIETSGAFTPSVALLELCKWYIREIDEHRQTERAMELGLSYVEAATEIVPLDANLARRAGEIDFLMKKRIRGWPLADSIIYATARSRSASVVTADPHFRGLDDVIFLGPT